MTTKAEKLAAIRKLVEEADSFASLDMYTPEWAEAILAILDEVTCQECGDYPRRGWRGPSTLRHYITCSNFAEASR